MIGPVPIRENLPISGDRAIWPTSWSNWFAQVKRGSAFLGSFTTANRPPLKGLTPGQYGLDTTLGIPIFVNTAATAWIDAAGGIV